MRIRKSFALLLAVAGSVAGVGTAQAGLTLTGAAVTQGFSLTNYYSDPGQYYGLLGVTTTSSGQVIGASYSRGQLVLLPDVDGQTYATATLAVNVSSHGTPYEVATVGGNTYYAPSGGAYYSVDTTTLALTPLALSTSVTSFLGLWANPVNGHLISSSYSGLVDINPLTGAVHVITTTSGFDGVTVSPDGTIAYGEIGGNIVAYNIASGALIATYSGAGHSPDGTGVISGSALNGDVVVNNNDGTIGVIDPTTGIETIIASGGTRGDFVGADLTNGTLFLAMADGVYRLALAGATIGGGPPTTGVPEPATLALFGLGLAGLGFARRKSV